MASHLHTVQRPGPVLAGYEAPATIGAALALLARHGSRAQPVAGGTDLLVELDRAARPGVELLVDLGRIPGLDEITAGPDMLRLGPMVTHNQVVASEVCRLAATPLAQACWEIGSPQLRNRATVAGNLITASPANDTISALLALGATLPMARRASTTFGSGRVVSSKVTTTAKWTTEMAWARRRPSLTKMPRWPGPSRGTSMAVTSSAGARAVVRNPVTKASTGSRRTPAAEVSSTVAPTVILVAGLAATLAGRPLDEAARADAAAAVTAAITPIDDVRATAAYRRQTAAVMTDRALAALVSDAQLDRWPVDPPLLWGRTFNGRYPSGPDRVVSLGPDTPMTTTVNGYRVTGPGAPAHTLLDWLRQHAGTNGVKEGCAEGECGACTVHLDGAAVMACLVPAGRAHGADILTVEGLAPGIGTLHPVQEAFVACGAVQCGYCTPGLLMASAKLLEEHPHATPAQVEAALAGNLCRCTGYGAIHRALQLTVGEAVTPVTVAAGSPGHHVSLTRPPGTRAGGRP